jgi:hypothetical protein
MNAKKLYTVNVEWDYMAYASSQREAEEMARTAALDIDPYSYAISKVCHSPEYVADGYDEESEVYSNECQTLTVGDIFKRLAANDDGQ